MKRKSSKEYSVVVLVEGKKFKLRNLPSTEEFIFVVGSAANSVGTTLEFAASGRDPDAKFSGASAFCFFVSTTLVLRRAENILPGKHQHGHVHLSCHGKK